jgi:hypothetical protein
MSVVADLLSCTLTTHSSDCAVLGREEKGREVKGVFIGNERRRINLGREGFTCF